MNIYTCVSIKCHGFGYLDIIYVLHVDTCANDMKTPEHFDLCYNHVCSTDIETHVQCDFSKNMST